MTNFIQDAFVSPKQLFTPLSRYLESRVFLYGERKVLTIESYKRTNYEVTGNEKSMLITKGIEYRPDLVAFDHYGAVDVWWRLLEANGMSDIFEFKAGKTIILPRNII